MEKNKESYFIGVDVGTRSVRAAIFTPNGTLCKLHVEEIDVFNPREDYYEQSSSQIWEKVCTCVKSVAQTIEDKTAIIGLGFDATCSLVVLGENDKPLSIQLDTEQKDERVRDIIMWMDHRASKETEFINAQNFSLLKYVGGKISHEMQMPKILWIKNNLQNVWDSAVYYFCLPDFLTYKATGNTARSFCSLVCKWNYSIDDGEGSWNDTYLKKIDLQSLSYEGHTKIGNVVLKPGKFCGNVSTTTASLMGLSDCTAVGASMIDAHAGGLGLMASKIPTSLGCPRFKGRLCLICGTSTCHMCVSDDPVFVEGVWGPFYSVMFPEMWLSTGGQSSTGSLVDHIINSHSGDQRKINSEYYRKLDAKIYEVAARQGLRNSAYLTKHFHIYPDFHGNRSPLDDPSYKGMICGLTLDSSEETLALKYLATLQALAYGTRDIVNKMVTSGHDIRITLMCGGLTKSDLFVQLYADVLDMPVVIPYNKESVLLGAAMLGACSSGHFLDDAKLVDIAAQMGSDAKVVLPCSDTRMFHNKKFEVFKQMQAHWKSYQKTMDNLNV